MIILTILSSAAFYIIGCVRGYEHQKEDTKEVELWK